jgi:hypothetical protein
VIFELDWQKALDNGADDTAIAQRIAEREAAGDTIRIVNRPKSAATTPFEEFVREKGPSLLPIAGGIGGGLLAGPGGAGVGGMLGKAGELALRGRGGELAGAVAGLSNPQAGSSALTEVVGEGALQGGLQAATGLPALAGKAAKSVSGRIIRGAQTRARERVVAGANAARSTLPDLEARVARAAANRQTTGEAVGATARAASGAEPITMKDFLDEVVRMSEARGPQGSALSEKQRKMLMNDMRSALVKVLKDLRGVVNPRATTFTPEEAVIVARALQRASLAPIRAGERGVFRNPDLGHDMARAMRDLAIGRTPGLAEAKGASQEAIRRHQALLARQQRLSDPEVFAQDVEAAARRAETLAGMPGEGGFGMSVGLGGMTMPHMPFSAHTLQALEASPAARGVGAVAAQSPRLVDLLMKLQGQGLPFFPYDQGGE